VCAGGKCSPGRTANNARVGQPAERSSRGGFLWLEFDLNQVRRARFGSVKLEAALEADFGIQWHSVKMLQKIADLHFQSVPRLIEFFS